MSNNDETMFFKNDSTEIEEVHEVLTTVYQSLDEKQYNAIDQLVGYLLSGDPAYITSYQDARSKIKRFTREEYIKVMLCEFLKMPDADE